MKRITIIRHSIRNRGGDKVPLAYLAYLVEKDYDVEYWTNEVNSAFVIHPKIRIRKIPLPGILGTIVFTLCRKFDSDVVLVDLILMVCLASFRNHKKVVYLAQDYDVTYYRSWFLRVFTDICYRVAFQMLKIPVITESEGLTRVLSKYGHPRLTTVFNGIDLEVYSQNACARLREERTQRFVALLFCREDYRKGLDIGKKALEELTRIRRKEDWEVWTIGPETIEIKNISVENKGFIKSDIDLRDILSAADIFLSTSRHEGFGLMQLEAMACGCAMVTTEAFSLAEHEMNALVSPVEDWQALAKNLNRVMNDAPLREKLQQNGRRLAEQFSLEKSCEEFERTLISFTKVCP